MEQRKQQTFPNCPKCGSEVHIVNYQDLSIECCPNCRGMFFDVEELKSSHVMSMETSQVLPKGRFSQYWDKIPINCPQCHTPMIKEKRDQKGLILDVCNSCRGIWFDQGEIAKWKGMRLLRKSNKIMVNYMCSECNLKMDYNPESPDEFLRRCPRCNEFMGIEGLFFKKKFDFLDLFLVIFLVAILSMGASLYYESDFWMARIYIFLAEQINVLNDWHPEQNHAKRTASYSKACDYFINAYTLTQKSFNYNRCGYAFDACSMAERKRDALKFLAAQDQFPVSKFWSVFVKRGYFSWSRSWWIMRKK